MSVIMSIRLESEVKDRLEQLASATHRSACLLVEGDTKTMRKI